MQNSQVTTLESTKPQAQSKPAAGVRGAIKTNGHDVALSGRKARITIHPADGEGGHDAVFLGLNGYAYQVPRGEPQDVPVELLEVLEHAISEKVSQGKDMQTTLSRAPRFAYTVHSTDVKEAVAA
jgi:hypothetical protein